MTVLVIAEHDHATLKPATLNTVTAGLACATILRRLRFPAVAESIMLKNFADAAAENFFKLPEVDLGQVCDVRIHCFETEAREALRPFVN